jgi:RNA polymerase sigma-70 factor (ECF subfamily)
LEELSDAVRSVRRGDPSAFQRIVETTSVRLVRVAARITGSPTEAEDIVQEAYVKAYRSILDDRFDGRSSVETWLYRIATNAAVDALRRRARAPEPIHDNEDVGETTWGGRESAEARVALSELDDWLGDLPPEQRAALVLKVVEGHTAAEVAEIMESSEGAVEQHLVRARAALRARRATND